MTSLWCLIHFCLCLHGSSCLLRWGSFCWRSFICLHGFFSGAGSGIHSLGDWRNWLDRTGMENIIVDDWGSRHSELTISSQIIIQTRQFLFLTGTEGPGAGVDWVTVVMALPWVVVVPAAAVVEAASVLLVPSSPSTVCWASDQTQSNPI